MEWTESVIVLVLGFVIGLVYFGGLWWTVQKLQKAHRPMAFYLASFAARLTIVAVCIFLVLQVGTTYLLIGIIGFFAARIFLVFKSTHVNVTTEQKATG